MPSRTRSCVEQIADVLAVEQDAAGGRPQHAGEQIDQRGLAGAVRPDQARGGRPSRCAAKHCSTATMPLNRFTRSIVSSTTVMASDPSPDGAASAPRQRPPIQPRGDAADRRRPRGDALAADQHDHHQHEADPERPILRRQHRQIVLHELEDDGADQAAIEIAGAADDQHQQQVGRAVERKHFERSESRRLRQQRAGDAGIAGGDGVDRDQAGIDRDADRRGAQRIAFHRHQRKPEGRIHQPAREQEQE